jgi:hypothetical protein
MSMMRPLSLSLGLLVACAPAVDDAVTLVPTSTHESLRGTWNRSAVYADGLPVVGCDVVALEGDTAAIPDRCVDVQRPRAPSVDFDTAISIARAACPGATETRGAALAIVPPGALVWRVEARAPRGIPVACEILVDAHDGDVVATRDLIVYADGSGSVTATRAALRAA